MSLISRAKRLVELLQVNDFAVRFQRFELLALCYHGVVAEQRPDAWSYDNCVDRQSFLQQIRWLKSLMEPTDLAGLRRWREGKWTGKKGPLLITFDDGYRNNLTQAAPILKQEGVPALFFLATGYVNSGRVLWNDEVRTRIMHWPEPEIRLPFAGGGGGIRLNSTRDAVWRTRRRKAQRSFPQPPARNISTICDPKRRLCRRWTIRKRVRS